MATASPILSPPTTADSLAEALNGLGVGVLGLEAARQALAACLGQDREAAAIQRTVDEAYHDGRLETGQYTALIADIGRYLGEDVPTEWSADVVSESAPASDTLSPGETPATATGQAGTGYEPGVALLERFILQARLGLTGTSELFRAIDRHRQQQGQDACVALKLAIPGAPRYEQALGMLQREAGLGRTLRHPHIARVFDFEQDDGHAFLTMEWLDGESLAELLTRQRYHPLGLEHTRAILADIAGALAHVHGLGITHADVKPGNIFLSRTGGARLLDFGTARTGTDAPRPAEARTPAYASCEVLEGLPPTPRDDVYSLACVVYRMLAGRRAFGHHDALAAEKSGRRLTPVRGLPAAQWAALARALAFRREARTADMATFIREFTATPAVPSPAPAPTTTAPAATVAVTAPRAPVAPARTPRRLAYPVIAALLAAVALFVGLRTDDPAKQVVSVAVSPVTGEWPPGPAPAPPVAATPVDPPREEARLPATTVAPAAAPATQPAGRAAVASRDPTAHAGQGAEPSPANREPALRPPLAAAPAVSTQLPAQARETSVAVAGTHEAAPASDPPAPVPAPAPTMVAATVAPGAPPAEPPLATAVEQPAAAGSAMPVPEAGPRQVPLSTLKLTRYVAPAEPRSGWSQGGSGWVDVAFVVGTDGIPRDVQVTGSQPADSYDEVALRAVRRWRFEPAAGEDGHPVERRTAVRLRFERGD